MQLGKGTHQNNVMQGVSSDSTASFSIMQSAKAFKVLSDSLYTRKILAPIREYSTNAVDALITANNTAAGFKVVLPTQARPIFAVEDNGPGISPDSVMKLYTTYFYSDKDGNDDCLGAYGLGSKSFLAYTDKCMITSWYNGEEHKFTIYVDGDQPKVSHVHTKSSTRCTGLRVEFPVLGKDFEAFYREAAYVYQYFMIPPTIEGALDKYDAYVKDTCSQQAVLYKATDGNCLLRSGHQDDSLVVVGGVPYAFSPREILRGVPSPFEGAVTVFAKIGEVDIPPARETLELTEKTKDYLIEVLTSTVSEMSVTYEAEVDAVQDFQELLKLAQKWSSQIASGGSSHSSYSAKSLERFTSTLMDSALKRSGKGFRYKVTSGASDRDVFVEPRTYSHNRRSGMCEVPIEDFFELVTRTGIPKTSISPPANPSEDRLMSRDVRTLFVRAMDKVSTAGSVRMVSLEDLADDRVVLAFGTSNFHLRKTCKWLDDNFTNWSDFRGKCGGRRTSYGTFSTQPSTLTGPVSIIHIPTPEKDAVIKQIELLWGIKVPSSRVLDLDAIVLPKATPKTRAKVSGVGVYTSSVSKPHGGSVPAPTRYDGSNSSYWNNRTLSSVLKDSDTKRIIVAPFHKYTIPLQKGDYTLEAGNLPYLLWLSDTVLGGDIYDTYGKSTVVIGVPTAKFKQVRAALSTLDKDASDTPEIIYLEDVLKKLRTRLSKRVVRKERLSRCMARRTDSAFPIADLATVTASLSKASRSSGAAPALELPERLLKYVKVFEDLQRADAKSAKWFSDKGIPLGVTLTSYGDNRPGLYVQRLRLWGVLPEAKESSSKGLRLERLSMRAFKEFPVLVGFLAGRSSHDLRTTSEYPGKGEVLTAVLKDIAKYTNASTGEK